MMETLSFGICSDSFFGQRRVSSVVMAIENLQKDNIWSDGQCTLSVDRRPSGCMTV